MRNVLTLLVLIGVFLGVALGCKAKETNIRAESRELILSVKQAPDLASLYDLASPVYQQAAVKAGETLDLSAEVLLSNSNFPVALKNAVIVPELEELNVITRGRFAEVSFSDDSGKTFTFQLVKDRGSWYFFLDTPIERDKYGEFKVR